MDNVIRMAELVEKLLMGVGGLVAAWSIYQMLSERSQNRPIENKEWWQLLCGAFLAALGMSGFIVKIVSSLQF